MNTNMNTNMNNNMQGHNHGGKSHLLWMLGVAGVVLVVLLGAGRSFQQALPYAFLLACPLMMVAMMFMMMRGNGHQEGDDATDQRDRSDRSDRNDRSDVDDRHDHKAAATWQDSPNITPRQPPPTTTRP